MVNRDKYNRSSKKNLLRRLEREAADDGVGGNGVGDAGVAVVGGATDDNGVGDSGAGGKKGNKSGSDSGGKLEGKESISDGTSEYKGASGRNLRAVLPMLIFLTVVAAVAVAAVMFVTDNSGPTVSYVGSLKSFDYSELYSKYEVSRLVPRCTVSSQESVPEIKAKVYSVVYVENFQVVAEKNAEERVHFASIVKLLGILVTLDEYDIDQEFALLNEVDTQWNGLDLKVGESVRVEELIGAALVGSRNDAMYVLSQNYPGGEEAFIAEMNTKAQVLGMKDTLVQNVIGLDDPDQYSTARDIGILSVVAMRNSVIRSTVSQSVYTVNTSSGRSEQIHNTNLLLGDVEGVVGLKTGYTGEAGLCLVSYVDDDCDFVTVVLNAEDRAEESRELIDWVRSSFSCE